ncbi:MAG: 4'-phosphopantetheinyl transferase superfamily protein [Fibrobacter sp.]|nr:4'-phosphopantetheinyl transferase superfamily protein [Fibrobacter sp.]
MIYLDDDLEHFDLEKALPFLSEQRRNQLYQFRFEQERKMCALSYLLLCDGLRKEYGITDKPLFEYGRYGKPSIQGHPEIHFNISHCSEAVICVLSECPVGVDIESLLEYEESLMTYTMNEYEKNIILNSSRPDMEFIRFWTMKEAVLKCEGEGLLDNIKSVLDKKRRSLELITKEHSKNRYVYSICYDKPFVNS